MNDYYLAGNMFVHSHVTCVLLKDKSFILFCMQGSWDMQQPSRDPDNNKREIMDGWRIVLALKPLIIIFVNFESQGLKEK